MPKGLREPTIAIKPPSLRVLWTLRCRQASDGHPSADLWNRESQAEEGGAGGTVRPVQDSDKSFPLHEVLGLHTHTKTYICMYVMYTYAHTHTQ